MEIYAQYLQKISDLITREGIFIPPTLKKDLLSVQQRSLLLDEVLSFSSQTNIEFNNKIFDESSAEEMLHAQLFLEFQDKVKERESLRAEEIQYQEEEHDDADSIIGSLVEDTDDVVFGLETLDELNHDKENADEEIEMGDDEPWDEAEMYTPQISNSPEQETEEHEEVSFEVSSNSAEFVGRDEFGIDIYGSHHIKPFQQESLQTDDSIIIKPIVFDDNTNRIPFTGKDEHNLDIYGEMSVQLFETNSESEQLGDDENNQSKTSDTDEIDKVVTINNTPVTSEELDKLATEAKKNTDSQTSSVEEEDLFSKELFPNTHYPKDIQESDKIIDIVANVEKKIGGFLRGFRKKD